VEKKVLTEFLPFDFALKVWGAYWAGDASEQDASLCESKLSSLQWDGTLADVSRSRLWHGDNEVAIPEWWCLPHLSMELREIGLAEMYHGSIA
jgi:hypothetical protein